MSPEVSLCHCSAIARSPLLSALHSAPANDDVADHGFKLLFRRSEESFDEVLHHTAPANDQFSAGAKTALTMFSIMVRLPLIGSVQTSSYCFAAAKIALTRFSIMMLLPMMGSLHVGHSLACLGYCDRSS